MIKLAIVAPEFPPSIGGMQAVAFGFAHHLTKYCDVVVVTKPQNHNYSEAYPVFDDLTGYMDLDRSNLEKHNADALIFMNAGYAPLASKLPCPCFIYGHGCDFLRPSALRKSYGNILPQLSRVTVVRKTIGAYCRLRIWQDMQKGFTATRSVFVNSNPMRDRLLRRYRIDPQRVSVIHPCIDEPFFQMPRRGTSEHFRILTVSRLQSSNRRKNIDGALRAIARIKDFPIRYTIVGDGDDKPRLEQLSVQLGISRQVTFLGSVDRPQLLELFATNDLFLLAPYRRWNDVEGFGIVYVESSASGLPVLATRNGGITDAVLPGVSGEFLSSASDTAIEAGIRMMRRDYNKYKTESMQEFASGFRWEQATQKLYERIQSALN